MSRLVAGAALLVALGSTAACGGKSSTAAAPDPATAAPSAATTAAFCGQALQLLTVKNVTEIRAWAVAMGRIGTPVGITAKERLGFEKTVDYASTVKSSDQQGGLAALDPSGGDGRLVLAFAKYAAATCPTPGASASAGASPSS